MIATGRNDRVIDSLIDNNNDEDDNEDIPLNSNLEIVTQFISTTPPPPLPRLTPRHKADFNNENASDASVVLASKIIHHSYILMQSIKVL